MEEQSTNHQFLQLRLLADEIRKDAVGSQENSKCLKDLYRKITELQYFYKYEDFAEWEKDVHSLFNFLLQIITKQDYNLNDLLLGGTCLAALLYKISGPENASKCLVELIIFFGNKFNVYDNEFTVIQDDEKIELNLDQFVETLIQQHLQSNFNHLSNKIRIESLCNVKPMFPVLAVVHGILSYHKIDLLACEIKYDDEHTSLFEIMFDVILKLCTQNNELLFHSFYSLLNWTEFLLQIICSPPNSYLQTRVKEKWDFSPHNIFIKGMLHTLEANWESPINGVSEHVRNVYKILFQANAQRLKRIDEKDHLIPFLLVKTMRLSWMVKGKYIVLASLLNYVDLDEFLKSYPETPTCMMSHIKANHIASILSEVYKTIIVKMKENDETSAEKWKMWWLNPILTSLSSDDKPRFQNIRNYILPVTFKLMPFAYVLLSESLEDEQHNSMAEVVLLKLAKDSHLYDAKPEILYEKLRKKMHHSSECVRIEVLTILCSSAKKSESVDGYSLELMKEFLVANFNIDSSAFNQSMMAQLKSLLVRIRDSAVKFLKIQKTINLEQIAFVDWLSKIALNNTFPGSCYQRRRTSLQILQLIFEVFVVAPQGSGRKGKPSANINTVIALAQEKGYWMFLKDNSLLLIFCCLSDFTDDIRCLSTNIIQSFFPWSTAENFDNSSSFNLQEFLKSGLDLCNNPDVRHIDNGSHICFIIFSEFVIKQRRIVSFPDCSFSTTKYDSHEVAIDFLWKLTGIAEVQLENAKLDFVTAAYNEPIHGMLHTIQRCISHNSIFLESSCNKDKAIQLLQKIMHLCHNTTTYMLSLMMTKSTEVAPSFEEISQALQSHLTAKNSKDNHISLAFDAEFNSCALTPEFQLLLSCCWHSIKSSCFLASELIVPILSLKVPTQVVEDFAQQTADILLTVLLKCRHRGVIEACSSALNKFCKSLLETDANFEEIPFELLKNGLDALADSTFISVTRRSAGQPLLIQAVVASEPNKLKEKFASFAIERLLEIINVPLSVPFDEKKDLPQVSAYHILKTLVADASLSSKIYPWLGKIFPLCISGFSSLSWAIRNAALQLFGVLLPRMCGQKKIRDDESEHNLLSPAELFMRCPNLYQLLLSNFKKNISHHNLSQLNPELVPLLSLIAKMSPEDNNETNSKYITDFKPILVSLLESPLWHVREMASTALASILYASSNIAAELEILLNTLFKASVQRNNQINGILLLVQKILSHNRARMKNWEFAVELLSYNKDWILNVIKSCHINGSILLKIIKILQSVYNHESSRLLASFLNSHLLDHEWAKTKDNYQYLLSVLLWSEHASVKDIIFQVYHLNQDTTKACLFYLKTEVEKSEKQNGILELKITDWNDIMNFVIESLNVVTEPIILQDILDFVVVFFSSDLVMKDGFECKLASSLICVLSKLMTIIHGDSISATALVAASLCIKFSLDNKKDENHDYKLILNLEFWITKFFEFSHPRKPELLKIHAAQFIANCGYSIVNYLSCMVNQDPHSVLLLISIYDGCQMLLVDENEEIRQKALLFTSFLPHNYKIESIQHNMAIIVLCRYMLNVVGDSSAFIDHLWCCLQTVPSATKTLQCFKLKKKMNLFEQEYVNIYVEPVILSLLHSIQLKIALQKLHKINPVEWLEKLQIFVNDVKHDIVDIKSILEPYVKEYSDISLVEYFSQPAVYLVLFKTKCSVYALLEQKRIAPIPEEVENELEDVENLITELFNTFSRVKNFVSFDWHFSSNFDFVSLLAVEDDLR